MPSTINTRMGGSSRSSQDGAVFVQFVGGLTDSGVAEQVNGTSYMKGRAGYHCIDSGQDEAMAHAL
jgi:hypothetical protein